MQIRFLGACNEIGRSGFAVKVKDGYILLDYGVIMDREVGFPMHMPLREVQAIILSHAHLDHSGSLPLFYVQGKLPVYGVEPTFSLANLLTNDFLHLSGYYLPFEYLDLQSMMGHTIEVEYNRQFSIGDAKVTLMNAGHIPGSSQILIEHDGRRLLYTGDVNTVRTQLVDPAVSDVGDVDAAIIESTYAGEAHPDREKIEEEFVTKCTEVVERDGVVLVPAFGVGRSQEIMMVLKSHRFQYPVYLDGMALKAMEILMNHSRSLRDPESFLQTAKEVEWVEKWQDRRHAIKTPSVIISPAGMLKGGAALFYMEAIARERKNAIFLVTYQIPGTPGRVLLEKKKFILHGRARRVEADVDKFDFSSHAGRDGLQKTLSKLGKKAKVYTVHGADGNCGKLASWSSKELGLEATAPQTGDVVDV